MKTLPEIIADIKAWEAIPGCTAFMMTTEDAAELRKAVESLLHATLSDERSARGRLCSTCFGR